MKKSIDDAMSLHNPRLLSASYFAFLAIIGTILIDTLLVLFGLEQILPVFVAVVLAGFTAGVFGFLFGKKIVHCPRPYRLRVFLYGLFMTLSALPFYDFLFLYILKEYDTYLELIPHSHSLISVYLFILINSFIIVGWWLAILSGLAAVYLRGHLVYIILHSELEQHDFCIKRKTITRHKRL
ncbi:hypothetical protein Lbir_1548 [Legionella birminghamensis]|uniref:Transmembrane protein n=1 Tax=Legionella birminghamensis TaxID=28083 RepID=A0A378IBC2_9GAMM|nr:hypothetical protein [Legionella birminghamensis]KTC71693.1 hypothetical protein Lbir_1548 [Legionella birminghamensis]STX32469.1 Uncharacterised protein [Legionella birminghamensis]